MMTSIRQQFHLLEFMVFLGWGLGLGLFVGILASVSTPFWWKNFPQSVGVLGWAVFLGPLVMSFVWLSWRVLTRPFRRTTFDKVFYGVCTFGIHSLCMLLMDVNAKYVVRRFYTGTAPIPFVYLKPEEPAVHSIGAEER